MVKKIKKAICDSEYRRCLLNVTRQIGTTTALCEYAFESMLNGNNVIYHTDSCRSREDVFKKLKEMADGSEYGEPFFVDGEEHTISVSGKHASNIKVVNGTNYKITKDIKVDILIVDNADFFQGWEQLFKKLINENPQMRVVIASCPSSFDGRWSMFKKIFVKYSDAWKVCCFNHEYDDNLRNLLSPSAFDMECNNYRSFFDPIRLVYLNIGDLLFMEDHPYYEKCSQ